MRTALWVLLALTLWITPAWAAPKKKTVTVPIDIGVGPAAHIVTGPVFADQPVHTGLIFSLYAVLDRKTLRKLRRYIPKQYRAYIRQVDEIRYNPIIFLPDTIFISPKLQNTGMYGASWRPVGVSLPLAKEPFRLDASLGLRVTYAYIHSDELPSPTHFLRPGLDAKIAVEIPFSKRVLTSFGWDSQFYPPQEVGGAILELGELNNSIWHIGQGFIKLHYRFPYEVPR